MRRVVAAALIAVLAVGGCAQAPVAPTIIVTPGPGKTDAAFKADQDECKLAAANATAGAAKAANQAAYTSAITGMVAGAVTGGGASDTTNTALANAQASAGANGTLQQQYDQAYGNCMYNKGNIVPGMAPPAPPPPPEPEYQGPVRDPLVMHVQQQLVRLGYLSGGADGIAGRKTAAAISKYEADHGLAVDGVSSNDLLSALKADHGSAGGSGAANPAGWVMPTATPDSNAPAPSK